MLDQRERSWIEMLVIIYLVQPVDTSGVVWCVYTVPVVCAVGKFVIQYIVASIMYNILHLIQYLECLKTK